ncbi:hypothetical protein EJB05_44211, partial [Eragrostis curvula]
MAEDTCSRADSEEIMEIASSMAQELGSLKWPDESLGEKSISCQIHRVHQLVRQIDRGAHGIPRIDKEAPGPSVISDVSETEYAVEQANRSSENSGKPKRDGVHEIELGTTDAGQQSSDCQESSSIEWRSHGHNECNSSHNQQMNFLQGGQTSDFHRLQM